MTDIKEVKETGRVPSIVHPYYMTNSISAIIPTFNNSSYIKEAVESVLKQTLPACEIIVVDDGSTDDTEKVLTSHVANGNIKYTKAIGKGPASARNYGVALSRGEFVAFLDADDIWQSDKLKKQIPLFEDESVGLVFSDMEYFGNKRMLFRTCSEAGHGFFDGKPIRELLRENFISTSSVVLRKSIFEKLGGFDERPAILEDYYLWLQLVLLYNIRYIPETLVKYRVHEGQHSRSRLGGYRRLMFLYKELTRNPSFHGYRTQLQRGLWINRAKYLYYSIFNNQ
jgi:glycosyltransferase involved in cell wall biosynthesis